MVQLSKADAEILSWAPGANARASFPGSELGPTAIDGPVVVDILCELEEGVCVCTLFVYLDSNSAHE